MTAADSSPAPPRGATRLSDAQHAALATAVLVGVPWRTAAAAVGLDGPGDRGPSAAARAFYRLVLRRGGWWCPVWCRRCAECGAEFVSRQAQEVHRACQAVRANARRRQRRAAGDYPLSTPAVRAWRAANPGRELALRLRERMAGPRARPPDTPARRAAHSRAAIASRQRLDRQLRATAVRHGAEWDPAEDAWLVAHQDWSAGAAAAELGRTSTAVLHRRRLLRQWGDLPPRGSAPIEVVRPGAD